MKKRILAVAVAGLSGASFAQSNVTISGQLRMGVESASAGGATIANANMTSRTRVTDNGSNIRFAGEEGLGNGLTAWFQVESVIGVAENQGTATAPVAGAANSTSLGTRNTAVGIKGAWGNLFVGKWDAHYNSGNEVDTVNGADAFGSAAQVLNITNTNGAAATATGRNAGDTFGGRQLNSIVFVTPSVSGFSAMLNYSTQGESTTPLLSAKDRAWAFTPKYSNGPIQAFYSYWASDNVGTAAPTAGVTASLTCINNATSAVTTGNATCTAGTTQIGGTAAVTAATGLGNKLRGNRLGGAYTFPMGLKIGLVWDRNKIETADGSAGLAALGIAATGGNVATHVRRERTAWALPIQYVSGAHRVNLSFAKAADIKTDVGTLADSGAKLFVLGYEYTLSKRTSVAALYSSITNGANAAYDFRESSASVAGTSGAGLSAGADPRVVQFSLRHVF